MRRSPDRSSPLWTWALLAGLAGCGRFGFEEAAGPVPGGDAGHHGGDEADALGPADDAASSDQPDGAPGAPDAAPTPDAPPLVAADEVRISFADGASLHPNLAVVAGGFDVVWDDEQNGNPDLYLARLGADGTPADPVRLTDEPGWEAYARSAWSGSNLAIAWEDDRDGTDTEIYFARYDADGNRLGAEQRLTTTSHETYNPTLVWTGIEYGLGFEEYDSSGDADIWFQRLDSDGNAIGTAAARSAGSGSSLRPSLVWNGTGYAVAWEDTRGSSADVYLAQISSTGSAVGGEDRATTSGDSEIAASLVSTGSGYGLAWQDGRASVDTIYFVRLDSDGQPLGTPIQVSSGDARARDPSLAWTGSGFGVAWDEGGELRFAAIDADGALIGAPQVVSQGDPSRASGASLVWTGAGFAVAWADARLGTGEEEIYVRVFQP